MALMFFTVAFIARKYSLEQAGTSSVPCVDGFGGGFGSVRAMIHSRALEFFIEDKADNAETDLSCKNVADTTHVLGALDRRRVSWRQREQSKISEISDNMAGVIELKLPSEYVDRPSSRRGYIRRHNHDGGPLCMPAKSTISSIQSLRCSRISQEC